MALYAPFYAAKNKPVGAKPVNVRKAAVTRKVAAVAAKPATAVKAATKAATRKASPATKPVTKPATRKAVTGRKSNCANAARRLTKCRVGVKTRSRVVKCTGAGKNLIACRWRR